MQSEEVSSFTPLYACLIDLVLPCRCSLCLKSVNRGVAQPLDWRIGTVLYVNCLLYPLLIWLLVWLHIVSAGGLLALLISTSLSLLVLFLLALLS